MLKKLCKGRNPLKSAIIGPLLAILISACAETKEIKVSYSASGNEQPDLVFIVRLEANSSSEVLFSPSLDSGIFASGYNQLDFGARLVSCAIQRDLVEDEASLPSDSFFRGSDCGELGEYVAQVVFDNSAVGVADASSDAALSSQLTQTGATTHFFVLFIYGAGALGADPRCVQMLVAEVVDGGFRYASSTGGFVTVSELDLELPTPVESINDNCFPLTTN